MDSTVGREDEDEEQKLLKKAIVLSLEETEEIDNKKEDINEQDEQED